MRGSKRSNIDEFSGNIKPNRTISADVKKRMAD
jgi:hypothetical protein